jgi:MFS family permease
MDEKIDKVIALAGNEHRYQYFTLGVIIFLWINCNFISCVLPFIEREPIVNYTDSKGIFHRNATLTNDICSELELSGGNYTVVKEFGYSCATEFKIECNSGAIGNIGAFAFIGNAAGGFVFSFISKLLSHKLILIISSFGFCLAVFLCTLVTSFDYFYALLVCEIFICLFGNCLCYSSLVVAQEVVSSKKRSLFSSIINVGYALCGIIYALLFLAFENNWRYVFYVLIGASLLTLILIWIFIYDSPRGYINNNNYDKVIHILEGIASFNGKLEEFRESIKQDDYQEIMSVIKGEPIIAPSERSSRADNSRLNFNKTENEGEGEVEFKNDMTDSKFNEVNLTTSLVGPEKNENDNQNIETETKMQKINVWSLFKYPSIRYKFLLLDFLWVGTRAAFNGVSISSKSFPGNFYVNIIVLFILESVSYCVSGILIDVKKIGRRGTLWIQYGIVVVVFILLAFINLDLYGALALNYIARFCCAGIEVIYYTYSIELYPTPVRSLAFGINATFGNAGSIGAPYLLEFMISWQFLVLLAAICGVNSLVLICLPETVGKPMVESIKEIDEMNKSPEKNEEKIEDDFPNENKDNNEVITNSNSDEEKKEEIKEENKEEKKDENKEENPQEKNEEDKKEKDNENKIEENKDVDNEEKMDDGKGPENN